MDPYRTRGILLVEGVATLAAGGGAVLVGLMHSPRPGGALFWPWDAGDPAPFRMAAGYLAAAVALLVLDLARRPARDAGTRRVY